MNDSQLTLVRGVAVTAFVLITLTTFASAMLDGGMRCDDVCSPNVGEHWRSYPGSSQWGLISVLGFGVLASGAGAWIASRQGVRELATVLLGAWVVAALGLALLQDAGEEPWLLLAFAAGAVMIVVPRRVHRPAAAEAAAG